MRTILCNAVLLAQGSDEPADLRLLARTMPTLGARNLLPRWRHPVLPRFVKTHRPYSPLFFSRPQRAVYILRDPRDSMVSLYDYLTAHRFWRFEGPFSALLRDPKRGLGAYLRHYRSWQSRRPHIVRYEDLRRDATAELEALFAGLGLEVEESIIEEAVERSRLDRMRRAEQRTGLPAKHRFKAGYRTVRTGRQGAWKEAFAPEDCAYYEELCRRYEFDLYP